eukprot:Gb_08376 [translate_table: standard]
MLKVSNGTFIEFNICTTVFENPHWGKSFVPFMKSTTLFDVMNLSKVSFSSGVNAPVLPDGP